MLASCFGGSAFVSWCLCYFYFLFEMKDQREVSACARRHSFGPFANARAVVKSAMEHQLARTETLLRSSVENASSLLVISDTSFVRPRTASRH